MRIEPKQAFYNEDIYDDDDNDDEYYGSGDYDIDDEGNYVSYAQLYFPYYSDKDKGGRVYFRNDKELDRKMRDIYKRVI